MDTQPPKDGDLVTHASQPATHGDIAALHTKLDQVLGALEEARVITRRLERVINGDPSEDVPGLRPRMRLAEERLNAFPSAAEWYALREKLDALPHPKDWSGYREKLDALPTKKEWASLRLQFNIGRLMVLAMWPIILAIVIAVVTNVIGGP